MKKGKKISNRFPVVGLVGVSAPDAVWYPDFYEKGKSELEKRGIQIVEGATLHTSHFYMAEKPELIAKALQEMFLKENVDVIMCAGGGTCINKVLPYIDFSLIRDNYKPFIGISNIVPLMMAMLKEGIVSFHGPFSIWSYGLPDTPTEFTHNNWLDIMSGYTGKLPSATKWKTYRNGEAEGILVGGNIWSIGTVAGTAYCPPSFFDGKILILEDIGKTFDRLDATLTHMKLLGMFNRLKGVVIGKLQGCTPPENINMSAEDLIAMVFGEYDFPVLYECDFGHIPDNLCLPFGCKVKIEANDEKPEIILLEPGVV